MIDLFVMFVLGVALAILLCLLGASAVGVVSLRLRGRRGRKGGGS